MIKYFITQKLSDPDIFQICDELNKLKVRIQDNDFTNSFSEFNTCEELFARVKKKQLVITMKNWQMLNMFSWSTLDYLVLWMIILEN